MKRGDILVRVTATSLISAVLATLVATAFTVAAMKPAHSAMLAAIAGNSLDHSCTLEAEAFSDLAQLAHSYRLDGDVFADALDDLRDQLLDCLATSEEGEADGAYLPSSDGMRSI